MFICEVADGTMCAISPVHIPVAAVCTVGHNENVDEGLQVKLLEFVPASPLFFCLLSSTSSAIASQRTTPWILQIYYTDVSLQMCSEVTTISI